MVSLDDSFIIVLVNRKLKEDFQAAIRKKGHKTVSGYIRNIIIEEVEKYKENHGSAI